MLVIGELVASFSRFGSFPGVSGQARRRPPLGIQLLPAVLLAIFILSFPKSRSYLAIPGHDEEVLRVVARLHVYGNIHDPFVKAEHAGIPEAVRKPGRCVPRSLHEPEHLLPAAPFYSSACK
jgi:hypothetical protein